MKWLQRIVRPRRAGLELRLDLDGRESLLIEAGRVVTTSLQAFGVRELSILDYPADLLDATCDLLLRLERAAAQEKPSRDGDAIGGALIDTSQAAIHVATLRVVARSSEPGSGEIFRVVDYEEPVSARFPSRLMATHLAALASRNGDPIEQEAIYRRSIDLFPGKKAEGDSKFAFDRGENLENYIAYEGLGEALLQQRRVQEGYAAFAAAEERCPAWAADFRAYVKQQISERPELAKDPSLAYWAR